MVSSRLGITNIKVQRKTERFPFEIKIPKSGGRTGLKLQGKIQVVEIAGREDLARKLPKALEQEFPV